MARATTQSTTELIADVRALGHAVPSVRQLERWRQCGCLPSLVTRSLGRHGSETRWPAGTAQQVVDLMDLLADGVSLADAPAILFYRGHPIDVAVLRATFQKAFSSLTANVDRIVADSPDPADRLACRLAAEAGRKSSIRTMEARLRKIRRRGQVPMTGRTRQTLAEALSVMMTGLLDGQRGTQDGVAMALNAFGLNSGQNLDEVADVLASINLDMLTQSVGQAGPDQWEQARTDLQMMERYVQLRTSVETVILAESDRLDGLANSAADAWRWPLALPVLLIVATPGWRSELRQELAQFEAYDEILNLVPARLRPIITDDSFGTVEEQSEFVRIVSEWAVANPERASRLVPAQP